MHKRPEEREGCKAEIEEGIAIFERACAQWPITSDGGRPTFSLTCLRNQLQSLIESRDRRRQQME